MSSTEYPTEKAELGAEDKSDDDEGEPPVVQQKNSETESLRNE